MKKFFWIIAAGAIITLAACSMKVASSSRRPGTDALIFRVHFVGAEQLFAAPESANLKEAFDFKSSAALRDEVLTRFALLPSFWLGDILPKGAATQTNLFR